MLVLTSGICDKCGGGFGSVATIDSVSVTCKSCNHQLKACTSCQRVGCPRCGGQLQDVRATIKRRMGQNVMFFAGF